MTDEGVVLERIESFRRRRPRLKDEIVTLAHGAGGKASAALVDAVFLEAFGRPGAADGGTGEGELTDAAVLDVTGAARIAITTDSFVVKPLVFPGGSIGH